MQRSEQINELAAALVKARAKFQPVKKAHTANVQSTKGSYKYTYSTLDDLYEATTASLGECGLVTLHNIETGKDGVGVSTLLMHQSGQFIQTDAVWLPSGSTPQSTGSAITYARRYSLQAALGIAAEEEDDDGQAAQASSKPRRDDKPRSAEKPRTAAPAAPAVISDGDRHKLADLAGQIGWTTADVKSLLARYGFASSKDITTDKLAAILQDIEAGVESHMEAAHG